jgi:hypothetical protein
MTGDPHRPLSLLPQLPAFREAARTARPRLARAAATPEARA